MKIAFAIVAGLAAGASAQTITSYDITDAAVSGMGNWAHTYSGTINTTGSDSANGVSLTRADYAGGSGTLNDGSEGTSPQDTQLFGQTSATRPAITVVLDQAYFVESITLFSFDSGNTIPGRIAGYDVTINGNTQSFSSTEFTTHDETVDLLGSGLDTLGATEITISNFVMDGGSGWTEVFAIGEIGVRGDIVPAPGALALLGLGGLVAGRRRR